MSTLDYSSAPPAGPGHRPTRWARHFQFAPLCFAHDAAAQTRPENVQFGLAHGGLETQQQPIIEMAGLARPTSATNL
jgi:hypothetical protein